MIDFIIGASFGYVMAHLVEYSVSWWEIKKLERDHRQMKFDFDKINRRRR